MGKRITVLVSGSGTNLQALLDDDHLGGHVQLVVSDVPGVTALERASAAGVAQAVVDRKRFADRAAWEADLAEAVAASAPDLVVLAGFMRILSAAFIRRWPILNVHPSLLPAFPGARAVEDALEWGVKQTGVTVHFVDEEVDHGPIVAQGTVAVEEHDTPETLHARIQALEHRLLPEAVRLFCNDRLEVTGRRVRVHP